MATYLTSGVLIVDSDPYAAISDPAAVAAEAATRQAADDVLTAAQAALDARVATLEVDPITAAEVTTQISVTLDALLDGAPAALDTLNELAAAIADDANYAATVTALVAAVSDRVTALEAVDNATQAELDTHTTATTAHGISTYGATLAATADAAAARTTLGLGTMSTQAATSYAALAGATFTGPVAVQPPTGPGEPSRITAYVPSTGRIQRDGQEVGDTGWRAISTWNSSGTVTGAALSASFAPRAGTPGGVYLTRRGNYSFVRITNLQAATTIAANVEAELFAAGILPSVGFTESVSGWTSIQFHPGVIGVVRWPTVDGPFMLCPGVAVSSGTVVAFSVTNTSNPILANTAWPTTLPGAQLTAPATLS